MIIPENPCYCLKRQSLIMRTTTYIEKTSLTKTSNRRLVGRLQMLLSSLGFGSIAVFARFGHDAGLDTSSLLAFRFLVAAAGLWTYFLIFNRRMIRINRSNLIVCAALGLAGYGIFSTLTFKAYEVSPASTVTLIFFIYPVFVMGIDWFILRERPELQLLLGAVVTLSGLVIGLIGSFEGKVSLGLLFALAGSVWYAAYVVATRKLLQNIRPQTSALYVISFAALGFWIAGGPVASHLQGMSLKAWIAVISIGLVSTVMAIMSFYAGLEKLGSAEASQIGTFELLIGLSLAGFVLGEYISLPMIAGATLVLFGILIGQARPFVRSRQQAEEVPCES
jgi:drug/metabolite transporter (DMT)-like permease